LSSLAYAWLTLQFNLDKCLDRGGIWLYDREQCYPDPLVLDHCRRHREKWSNDIERCVDEVTANGFNAPISLPIPNNAPGID